MGVNRWLVVFLLGVSSVASGAESREAAATKALAGTTGKKWTRVAMKVFLGAERKCTQGETWLFRPDGHVRIDRCIDKKVVPQDSQWRLHVVDALDMRLTVGSDDYILLMPEIGNGTKAGTMVLRSRSDIKPNLTHDIELRYEKD